MTACPRERVRPVRREDCGAGRLLTAALAALFTCTAARASQDELRAAGERYAAGDVGGALSALDEVVSRGGGTDWLAEALFLRALLKQRELGEVDSALRDLRLLTVAFRGGSAAVFGQYRIAKVYEDAGRVADAYREYVLCSRLRGEFLEAAEGRAAGPVARGLGELPAKRITPEGARRLVFLARARAVEILVRLPAAMFPAERATEGLLPPGVIVVPAGERALAIPPDPGGRPASGVREDEWYLLPRSGGAIAEAEVELSARVDPEAAGPEAAKGYRVTLEPFPARAGGDGLVLGGGWRDRAETLSGARSYSPGARALRLAVRRSGARVTGCVVRLRVAEHEGAAEPREPPVPRTTPEPFTRAVEPLRGGVSSPALVSGWKGRQALAFQSPAPVPTEAWAPWRAADGASDIHLCTSPDGRTWGPPRRLPFSSATEDADPSLAVLRDGRLLAVWTSDRRGFGASDIYASASADGGRWSDAVRVRIEARDLLGMRGRLDVRTGVRTSRARVTFHSPELLAGSDGRLRLFFAAHGFRAGGASRGPDATGVYTSVSSDGMNWSDPSPLLTTPCTPLERFRPAPRSGRPEVVSSTGRISAIECEPGRTVVAWLSSCGRTFLSSRSRRVPARANREPAGHEWRHLDARLSGATPAQGARAVELLGPLGPGAAPGSHGAILIRRDLGSRVVWKDPRRRGGWRAEGPGAGKELGRLLEVAAAPVAGESGGRWLTAWVRGPAGGPSSVLVRELAAPDEVLGRGAR